MAFLVVAGCAAAAIALAWLYFRRYRVTRPPVGVINLRDVAIMTVAIVLIPYLYLALPLWLVAGILALLVLGVLSFTLEPVLGARWAVWLAALALAGADVAAALLAGAMSAPFLIVNNAVLTIAVLGVANLWAQSGMKARDAALLAAALAVYDVVATGVLTLMTDLVTRLSRIPFAPLVAWDVASGGAGIGLGDLLLASVFPLVMRKAFGRTAGLVALAVSLAAVVAMLAVAALGLMRQAFPAMVVLGPLSLAQYLLWRRRLGRERTTRQYLQADPV